MPSKNNSLTRSSLEKAPPVLSTSNSKIMNGYTIGGGLDFAITDNFILRTEYNYSDIDFKMMPALIKQANNKYPEMNLRLVTTFKDLGASVQKTIGDGIQSSRFIVNVLTDVMPHFVVIDHKTINNKLSFILFECTRCNNEVSLVLISNKKSH